MPSLHVSLNCRWNFDWFHATQVEESDNHALFFECKRRHFSIKNTTATRPRHKYSTGSTVLPLGLAEPEEQPCLLQQLPRFYLLPFPRKKLGYLTTWTPHVCTVTTVWASNNTGVLCITSFYVCVIRMLLFNQCFCKWTWFCKFWNDLWC